MTLKKSLIMAMLFTAFTAVASFANEIYVEQVGDGATVTITQQGTGNSLGDNVNSAYIGGNATQVTVDQIGSGNSLALVVNGAAATVTVTTNGDNNIQNIQCGTTTSAGCSGSTITQVVTGDDNTVSQLLGAGANHTSTINVTGDSNTVTHTSTNTGTSFASITVDGSSNTVGVTQSGITAKSVTVSTTGTGNTISIDQSN
jgi:hypothetical protein